MEGNPVPAQVPPKLPDDNSWYAGQAPLAAVDGQFTGPKFEEIIDEALRAWVKFRPNEPAEFAAMIAELRDESPDAKMFTRRRAFRHEGEIPTFVYYFIARRLRANDWGLDTGLRRRFYKRFVLGDVANSQRAALHA